MKRNIAALLAALLLVSLGACQKTPEAPAEPEEPAAVEPVPPEEPAEPAEAPAPETPEEPVAPPEEQEEPEEEQEEPVEEAQLILTEYGAYTSFLSESGEPCVSYYPSGLRVDTGSQAANEIINEYYSNVFQKFTDFCGGEVMELTENGKYHYRVAMESELARFDLPGSDAARRVISIIRTVVVYGEDTGLQTLTYYGETFDCVTGGLLTADDFFAVPEETYLARLADCVRQAISEDPYHDQIYFAQWEEQAARALRKENFYVTEDAYVVFYQENGLGAESAVFFIPWSQLEDITA